MSTVTALRARLDESAGDATVRPVGVSFEFFPPGDADTERALWAAVLRLAPLQPRFVSIT